MQTNQESDGPARVSGDIAYLPPFPSSNSPQSRSAKLNERHGGAGGIVPQGPISETRVLSEGRTTQRLYLSSLPPQMAKALAVYDTDFDGILSEKDVAAAAADLQHMQSLAENEKEGKIPLDFFPDEVRKLLNEFDENNDGELDVVEIMHGFNALEDERRRRRGLVRMVTGMIIFTAILCVSFAYLFAFVVDESEDTSVGSAVMRTKDGQGVVQMASAQFAVKNGVLVNRPAPDADCSGDTCTDPLQMSQSLQQGMLHSVLNDTTFAELRHLKIASETSWIHFKVMATARYSALGESQFGSVVVIYTHLGEITLDGDQLSFHESLEGSFARAGFEVDPSGRRLLSTHTSATGSFNSLSQPINQALINSLTNGQNFASQLSIYTANLKKAVVCTGSGDGCTLDGADVNHLDSWGSGKAQVELVTQELYEINGEPWSRTESTKLQFPTQAFHEIYNATHKLSYQTFTNINAQKLYFHCELSESDDLLKAVTGSKPTTSSAASTTSNWNAQSIADITVGGATCKGWKIEVQHDSGTESLEYYEKTDGTVCQINFADLQYVFDSISTEASLVEAVPAELDMQNVLSQCDPANIMKPQKYTANEVSNAYQAQTAWGLSLDPPRDTSYTTTSYEAADFATFLTGYCTAFSYEKEIADGKKYTVTQFKDCNDDAQIAAIHVKLSFTDDGSDDCFIGSGSMELVRDCTGSNGACSVHTTGSMNAKMNIWECFQAEGGLPASISGLKDRAAAPNLETEVSIDLEASVGDLSESCSLPPAGLNDYQIGKVFDAVQAAGVSTKSVAAGFPYGTGNQVPAFDVEAELTVDTLLAVADGCGTKQTPGTPQKVGFRFGYKFSGILSWNTCLGQSDNWQACKPEDARISYPFEFTRRIFPTPGDYCGFGNDGVYRYQCSACQYPIGFEDVVATDNENNDVVCTADERRRRSS